MPSQQSRSKASRRYKALKRAAEEASQYGGDKEVAAHKCLEAFSAAPSKLLNDRLHYLVQASRSMDGFQDRNQTIEDRFKHISNDVTEPLHIRVVALICRANIQNRVTNYTKEVTLARRALALADQIGERERKVDFIAFNPEGRPYKKRVSDLIDEVVGMIKAGFGVYELGAPDFDVEAALDNLRLDTENKPLAGNERQFMRDAILRRCSQGGFKCECCQKTPDELGKTNLFKCSRCKLSFYCSKACQSENWENGHKTECRKYGSVSSGDWMLIHSLKNRVDLNGKACLIQGPVLGKEGRWEVYNMETGNLLSIASKNLRHSRPLK